MLTKPKAGWSEFNCNGCKAQISYVDDTPIEWLKTILSAISENRGFVLGMDEEGSEAYVVCLGGELFFIHITDQVTIQPLGIDMYEFVSEVCDDIKRDLYAWAHWIPTEMTEEAGKRCEDLLGLIESIRKVVPRLR